jgi:hypothetical protein
VNEFFESSVPDIFAAGDCCCLRRPSDSDGRHSEDDLWFQMRLWTQARQMGEVAAQQVSAPFSLKFSYLPVLWLPVSFWNSTLVVFVDQDGPLPVWDRH